MTIAGKTRDIQIIEKDSQSDPNRAAQVASDLITSDGVDLMLVEGTPETTNPVSGQCEANGVPCVSTVAPWQPWFLGQQKDPANPVPFKFAYHFFWGLEDIEQVFLDMWNTINTNKKVAGLFPNDGDGNAWGDPNLGFPSFFGPNGYTIVDPGRYEDGTQDFSAQISAYKKANAQILTGVPIPPDFTNFWKQANQQGFVPKIASVGKALLFPSSVEALGPIGEGMSTEYWWGPTHPFSSSLTDQTAQQLADAYTTSTSKAVDAADRLRPRADRGRDRCAAALDGPHSGRDRRGDRRDQPEHDRRTDPVDRAAVPERRQDASSSAGNGRRARTFPYELVVVSNKRAADGADRRNIRSDPRIVRQRIRIEPDRTW